MILRSLVAALAVGALFADAATAAVHAPRAKSPAALAPEQPLPVARPQQGEYDLPGETYYGPPAATGPRRETRDPIYGDLLYGGTAAPREGAYTDRSVQMRIGLNILSVSETDLKDSAGDVDVNRGGLDFGIDVPVSQDTGLSFNATYEVSRYNFDGVQAAFGVSDSPFKTVHMASLSASAWRRFGGGFTGFGTYALGAGWQEGSEPSDGQTYLLSAGGTYEVEPDLHLGFAVMAVDLLEKQLAYLIYPIVDWRVAPEWRIATAETGLPGIAVFFEPDDRFSIYGALGIELRQFRTSRNGDLPNVAVRDERVRASGGVRWRLGSNTIVWTEGGAYTYQQIEGFNNDGDTLVKERLDPTLFAGVRVQISF